MLAQSNVEIVRSQYEDLPYPPVDPQDELNQLKLTILDYPARVNHYGFGGRRDFSRNFRILIAGGGTGNSAMYLAEHYGTMGAEIVYLDLSATSMKIAKKRAALRKIDIITFMQGSLLDIPSMDLGLFDYIECSGVLHHLPDPMAGLKAIVTALKKDGVVDLMVYGQIGRTAIYQMQKALTCLLRGEADRNQKIEITRELVSQLPSSNWFNHNRHLFQRELSTDAGLYDLLLHSQDRAYTIPEIYDWLSGAGLTLITLLDNYSSGRIIYDPSLYNSSLQKNTLAALSQPKREELAELLAGNMIMHSCYAARTTTSLPDPKDESFVPVWGYLGHQLPKGELGRMVSYAKGPHLTFQLNASPYSIQMAKHPSTATLLSTIDEIKTISAIISEVAVIDQREEDAVRDDFKMLYEELNRHDLLLLRHMSVPPYPDADQLQAKMLARRQRGKMLSQILKRAA